MAKLHTPFGIIYMESPEERREFDRIEVFDSDNRYIDYFDVEYFFADSRGNFSNHKWDVMVKTFNKMKTVEDFLDYLCIDTVFIGNKEETEKFLIENDYAEVDGSVLNNEFVNRIRDTYFVVTE